MLKCQADWVKRKHNLPEKMSYLRLQYEIIMNKLNAYVYKSKVK